MAGCLLRTLVLKFQIAQNSMGKGVVLERLTLDGILDVLNGCFGNADFRLGDRAVEQDNR